jgi:hypothetical protein
MTDELICPRCNGFIPSNSRPGAYPGALSRTDNETEICSDCGSEEALVLLAGKEYWPVTAYFDGDLSSNALARAVGRLEQVI